MHRPAALPLALALALFVLTPFASLSEAQDDFRPLEGLDGPRATLRMYGCSDLLGTEPDPYVNMPNAGGDGQWAPPTDGRLDCTGDRLRLGHAWLDPARDPFHRAALGAFQQTIVLDAYHHPDAWWPGPDQADGIASLVDPTAGFFDRDADGRFDPAYVFDEDVSPARDDDDVWEPVDAAPPRDRIPDIHPVTPGGGGSTEWDLSFPAVETRYTYVWQDATGAIRGLPPSASFLFPTSSQATHLIGLDSHVMHDDPAAVTWWPVPLGIGNTTDGLGALVGPPLLLGPGTSAAFLDHRVQVGDIFDAPNGARVSVSVDWLGGATPEPIGRDIVLTVAPGQPGHATARSAPAEPTNLLVADRVGTNRDRPNLTDPTAPDADDAWFVLIEAADPEADTATVRLGRFVSDAPPLNAFVADRVLYHIPTLDEHDGQLTRFAFSAILPLGDDRPMHPDAVRLEGIGTDVAWPLLPPFGETHQTLRDLAPPLDLGPDGFLAEDADDPDRWLRTDELALRRDARGTAERADTVGPLQVQWRSRGVEDRLIVPMVGLEGDRAFTESRLLPANYLEVVLPDGVYRVDSRLLDDEATLTGATQSDASPRGFRSFLFDPRETSALFLDADGLRVHGTTAAHPAAGDRLVFDPAIVPFDDHPGRVRAPDALVHQAVGLTIAYDPYHPLTPDARPVPLDDTLQESPGIFRDNLWDARPAIRDTEIGLPYAPAILADHTWSFVERNSYEGVVPGLGARTALLVPAADRDPDHPGLDSYDLDGDGVMEEIVLRGFWDISRPGPDPNRFTTGGTHFADDGNASSTDLLWLQSATLTLGVGGQGSFFDHGVRYEGTSGDSARFTLLDQRGSTLRVIGAASADDVRACVPIRFDHQADEASPCGDLQVTDAAAVSPQAHNTLWWVEVLAFDAGAATLTLNRVITDVDRDPAGDDTSLTAGGQRYSWTDIQFAARGSSWRDGLSSFTLRHHIILGEDVTVTTPGRPPVVLEGMADPGTLPLLPPFSAAHDTLQRFGVVVETNDQGLLDSRGDPGDGDIVLAGRALRVDPVDALEVSWVRSGIQSAHRFVHLDPARVLDPTRAPGHAFVNGQFAVPWSTQTDPGTMPRLRTNGDAGYDEALRTAADRGWDMFLVLDVANRDRVVIDSARLGRPGLTAATQDAGVGRPGASLITGAHPNDPGLVPDADRASGLWIWPTHDRRDLYIGTLGSLLPDPSSPTPSTTRVPDEPPLTTSTSPDPSEPPREDDDAPGVLALPLAAVLVLAWALRRRDR